MEGDMQNVLKIARDIKKQIEALDRAVSLKEVG